MFGNNAYVDSTRRIQDLMYGVFGWMSVALSLTGITAYFVAHNPVILRAIVTNQAIFIGLLIFQLAIVFILAMAISRISYTTALLLFIFYSILTGVTLSTIFIVYTTASITATFFITAGMFGAMALYGYYTRSDLTSLGSILNMMLIGLIIAMVVNIFLKSDMMQFVLAFLGVIIFSGLTAFDMQRIKYFIYRLEQNDEIAHKIMIIGALQLYLDFINLFLSLLQIMGKKNER